jgi:hypothetical protein
MKTNNQDVLRLLEKIKKLSPTAKLILAERMFDTQLETDNQGQLVIYTGLVRSDKGRIRNMRDSDFTNN